MSQNPGRPDEQTSERGTDGTDLRGDLDERRSRTVADERGWDERDERDDSDDYDDDEPRRGFGATILAGLRELVIVIVLAMALSFVVKTWLFQAFYIPSGSMENTLVKDDRVIVSKLTPGPFDLRRGDVVVFEDPGSWLAGAVDGERSTLGGPFHEALVFVGLLPEDAENHLIKRVIGLPGDHVQSKGGEAPVLVNGVAISEPYWKHGDAANNKAFDIVVPAGRIWVMGDNRSDSSDSRWHDDGTGRTGSVPIDKLVGRAIIVVWPIEHVTWLGVPERTFEKVPVPSSTSTPSGTSTGTPTGKTSTPATTTKAAAG